MPSHETNREGLEDYAIDWGWAADRGTQPGMTAIVRVKNECRSLPFVLPPLMRAVSHVVLVDNNSTDGTPEIAAEIATKVPGHLEVVRYPFDVSRCGPEHLGTPPDSVHSLTYFYNWSFAHVRTMYAIKWDGDMVLTEGGIAALRDLTWQLEGTHRIITMRRYPLYVASPEIGYLDVSPTNREAWGWPNLPEVRHVKAFEWELPRWPQATSRVSLPDWLCIELKHLDADEFAHWSAVDFGASGRTARKQRESMIFAALSDGAASLPQVVKIEAPQGQHIVDHVRLQWIPEHSEELARLEI